MMTHPSRTLVAAVFLLFVIAGCDEPPAGEPDYAEAVALEHAHDVPDAAFASRFDTLDVITARAVYGLGADEAELVGFLARPAVDDPADPEPEDRPAVIVIHEWWGLNDNIRDMARLLADDGYVALAVDLYGADEPAQTSEDAQRMMGEAMDRPEALEANIRQAYDYLVETENASRVAVIGWCFGGMWALRTAIMLGDDLDAAVIFYGQVERDRDRLAQVRAPVLGIFGEADGSIAVEDVRRFERTLEEEGRTVEIHIYEGAGHAFANPSGRRYEPEAAEDAWRRTEAFLRRHLQPGDR
jgi:carboxymethylenebutenolidase